jgi:hypothetical protein
VQPSGPWSGGHGPGHPPPYPVGRPTNSTAITALILGIVSFISCQLIGVVAIYLGSRARTEIRSTGEDGDGLALAGVILGWVSIGIFALVVLFFVGYLVFMGLLFGSMAATS